MANPVANNASYTTPAGQTLVVGQGEFTGRAVAVKLRVSAQAATFSSVPVAFAATAVAARLRSRASAASIDLSVVTPTTLTTLTLSPTITGTGLPVTFGHSFPLAAVPAGASVEVVGKTTQFDAKSTHADGSVRHAILTTITDASAGVPQIVTLRTRAPVSAAPISKADVLATAFDAGISVDIGGTVYALTARDLLSGTVTPLTDVAHLSGPQVSEFILGAALRNGATPHAHLTGYFHVRAYGAAGAVTRVRVSTVVENGWTMVASPGDVTYNATLSVAGSTVFTQNAVVHYAQARFVKRFWWNGDPQVYAKPNHLYLQDSKAVPKYLDVTPDAATLNALPASYALFAGGNVNTQMSATGAAASIGPVPEWCAQYLVSGDQRAYNNMLANGDAAGSWGIHYRDEATGYPVSVDDRPTLQIGNTTLPPSPNVTPLIPDDAHQPSMAAVPYLVTGDYFYLEEMQFWNSWNIATTSPGTRVAQVGLQKRAQAWSFRTMAQCAALTPDAHARKTYYTSRLTQYLDKMYDRYIGAPVASDQNTLGVTWDYDDEVTGTLSGGVFHPWMDDYLTWAIGHAVEQGFTGTASKGTLLRNWKTKFITARMGTDDYPWPLAGPSYLRMGTNTTWAADIAAVAALNVPSGMNAYDVGTQQFADHITAVPADGLTDASSENSTALLPNEMVKYGHLTDGRPNEASIAICTALDAGTPGAILAWHRYSSRAGGPTPTEYGNSPRFALCPRDKSRTLTTPMQMAVPPAYVTAMAANSFRNISPVNGFTGNLTLSQVYDIDRGTVPFNYQPVGIMEHWVGASYDWINHQFVIGPGGGHDGHYGNDTYSFGPLTSDNPQWTLRRQMSVANITSSGYYADGRPSATHSYEMVQFDPITQQHINYGSGSIYNTGNSANIVFGFRLDAAASGAYDWDTSHPIIPGMTGIEWQIQGSMSAFDTINARAYYRSGQTDGLKKYSPAKKSWFAYYGGDGTYLHIDRAFDVDPKRRFGVLVGSYARLDDMHFYNIDTGTLTAITNVSGPADTTFWNSNGKVREKLGLAFHPPSGKFVAINNQDIWLLTPPAGLSLSAPNASTWTWTKKSPTGDTHATENIRGTYSRFRWVPEIGCFMVADTTTSNVCLYKPDF